MKKLNLFIIILLGVMLLSGCSGSKNDFKEVSRITFTTNGIKKTIYPSWYIIRGDFEQATEEEYQNSRFNASVMAPSEVSLNSIEFYTSELFSGDIHVGSQKPFKPHGISEQDIGDFLYIYAHNLGHYTQSYYKTKIKDVGSISLGIKIIDNTTIVIKRGVIETTYTVTSYSIVE